MPTKLVEQQISILSSDARDACLRILLIIYLDSQQLTSAHKMQTAAHLRKARLAICTTYVTIATHSEKVPAT